MIRSFRVRLTLWYVGCFAALFALLTAGLYGVLSRALTSRLDESLLSQAATASALFQDEMGETQNDPVKSAQEERSPICACAPAKLRCWMEGKIFGRERTLRCGGCLPPDVRRR